MIKKILNWFNYNARRRQIDIDILWPICKNNARNLEQAKGVLLIHALNDPAWIPLGEDVIINTINDLK